MTRIGLEFFEAGYEEYLLVTNPDPRWWWVPLWIVKLLGLTKTHLVEA